MTSYCVKCKEKTEDVNPEYLSYSTKKSPTHLRYMKKSTCAACGTRKSMIVKNPQEGGFNLSGIFKSAMPMLKSALPTIGKTLGKAGLELGIAAGSQALQNKMAEDSAQRQAQIFKDAMQSDAPVVEGSGMKQRPKIKYC